MRAPAPTSPSAQRPAPPPSATNWRDAAATPGTWAYGPAGTATFAGGLLTLRCDPRNLAVTLTRAASPRAQGAAISITTFTTARTLTARSTATGIEATLGSRDPLLDSMAFSRGRFAVAVPGEPTLYVPSWTEMSRVIEDCR